MGFNYLSFVLLGKLWIHIEFCRRYYGWFGKGTGYVDGKPNESHVDFGIPRVGFIQIMYFHHNNHPSKYFCFVRKYKKPKN